MQKYESRMLVCLIISIGVLCVAWLLASAVAVKKYKRNRIITPKNSVFVGTFLSAVALFVPYYYEIFSNGAARIFKTALISVHHAIRLFIVDTDFEVIRETVSLRQIGDTLANVYSVFAAILFILAPILTFNFILSFFKNVACYRRYWMRFYTEAYVFSELNEKSLALAKSLLSDRRSRFFRTVVFTDVFSEDEETDSDLVEEAHELGTICFKKDILAVNFRLLHFGKIRFFAVSEEEEENIKQAIKLFENYKKRKNTELYVFTNSIQGELLMTSANSSNLSGDENAFKVRCIRDANSLIYRMLYQMSVEAKDNGELPTIFAKAKPHGDIKEIGAVVVGCGSQGTEMIKALSWFCQMDGYRVSIDVFDKDKAAESKFRAQSPELMDEKYNGVYVNGEAQYSIIFHSKKDEKGNVKSGIDTESTEFVREIEKLSHATYVFVSLGSDEDNIRTAVAIRRIFRRIGSEPTIHAVVYSPEKKNYFTGITNMAKDKYDIDFVGDLDTTYSEDVIFDKELEDKAKEVHKSYGGSICDFYAYEYNYRSSMASAIHRVASSACGFPTETVEGETNEERKARIGRYASIEHCRWNAYTRSEGYIYGADKDHLAMTHPSLVNYEILDPKEKEKDIRVIIANDGGDN